VDPLGDLSISQTNLDKEQGQIEQLVDYIDNIIYIARQSDTLDLLWATERVRCRVLALIRLLTGKSKAYRVHPRGSPDPDFDVPRIMGH
jgi:hypothetical protein